MKINNLSMNNLSSYNLSSYNLSSYSFTNIIKNIWEYTKYILNHTFHPKYYYPECHDTDSDSEL